ncbi:MAG TPA: type II toxin-antitoxin system PemK/MazF family toxin [Myxococcota bacterium]|nr:type II toxin-antitoxin system PemK/MazF family toxin [Myxococcota bacterium]HYK11617.1 type II toxin-antitoxin system PemK/MazF family toxin [Gemmatimonadales bacterium]
MVIRRGDIWWGDLGEPRGSAPGFRRPVLIVQSDGFNASRIATIIAVAITSNLRLIDAPGNVLLPRRVSGLPQDSVINVSQLGSVDRHELRDRIGALPGDILSQVDSGLRMILSL